MLELTKIKTSNICMICDPYDDPSTCNPDSGWCNPDLCSPQDAPSSNMSNATPLLSSALSNTITAGTYLTSTYKSYYWKRG